MRLLISDESSLPVEAASQSSIEILLLLKNGITAALPEGILTASFEEVATEDNADSPQDLPYHTSLLLDL